MEDPTALNTGPWSELAIVDLRACAAAGDSLEEAASFLCRGLTETQIKADELGLQFQRHGTRE
jgi:NADPH:quinone reductase-like Zn-dependent oxidoreductase